MAQSHRLRLHEIRQIHELVSRIRDVGEHPDIWQRVALEGLIALVGGNVGFAIDCRIDSKGIPQMAPPIDIGWQTESVRRRFQEYLASGEMASDPGTIGLLNAQQNNRHLAHTRRELVDDKPWYQSPCVSEARRSGDVDDFVLCSSEIVPNGTQGFIIYRGWREAPFTPRQRRIMRLFHLELLRAVRDGATTPAMRELVPALPPRMRQPFQLMLGPMSLKEIAAELHLSRHTINDYQKDIYRILNIRSRPELMSLFMPPRRRIRLPANLE